MHALTCHGRVAAGQNTTFFIAKPSEKLSDLPRHPFEMEAPELCVVCNQDTGDDPNLLVCERVRAVPRPVSRAADI